MKGWQQQTQLQAWFGIMTWQDVEIQTDAVFDITDIVWPIVKALGLVCDSPIIVKTYTGKYKVGAYPDHDLVISNIST